MAANDPVELRFETCPDCGAVCLDTGVTPPAMEVHAKWHAGLAAAIAEANRPAPTWVSNSSTLAGESVIR